VTASGPTASDIRGGGLEHPARTAATTIGIPARRMRFSRPAVRVAARRDYSVAILLKQPRLPRRFRH
jgi:hypothetical protein